ncbi:unnamed protein product [Brassicogethes aeneus]|uniref:Uncharacterized protein n=1 Tax=Brassicogethes aeneus TaxID=1431903 RepID=A0A9P0B8U6_BRAAE|nr:unnamed protein product [Brassicogethes aeneus]
MFLFIVVGLLLYSVATAADYEKCCAWKSSLYLNNSTFECKVDNNTRLTFLSEKYDYISKNTDGYCVDGAKDFTLYNIKNNVIAKSKVIQEYFPKCCPLNYKFDTIKHYCVFQKPQNQQFIESKYIKIGLPQCHFIVDHKINSTEDYKIEEDGIHLKQNNSRFRTKNYCVEETTDNKFMVRVCQEKDDICKSTRCIRKCCPDGQSFVGGNSCMDTYDKGVDLAHNPNIMDPTGNFTLITFGGHCKGNFSIDDNGTVKWVQTVTNTTQVESFANSTFCIEYVQGAPVSSNITNGYNLFKCKEKPASEGSAGTTPEDGINKFNATIWAKVASIIFLTITIIIYFITNEVRNVFGKVLVNYCLSILILFSLLLYNTWYGTDLPHFTCVIFGYTLIYFSTSLFTWMNVCCFDIWYNIGWSTSISERGQTRRNIKKMLLYLLYGWGVPLFLIILILIFNQTNALPLAIHPFIGFRKCYLDNTLPDNYASIVFKEVPHLMLEIINTVLFIKTIIYCIKVKNEINRMNDTSASIRSRMTKDELNLITKLSVIMGLFFVFEVISAYFNMSKHPVTKYIEVVWDTINCLQGVFVFIIFICKKRIWMELRKKLYVPIALRKISASSSKSTDSEYVNETPNVSKKEQIHLSKL